MQHNVSCLIYTSIKSHMKKDGECCDYLATFCTKYGMVTVKVFLHKTYM